MAYDKGMAQRIREMLAERTDTSELRRWIEHGVAYASSLPAK